MMLIENKLNNMRLEVPAAPNHVKSELMKKISLTAYQQRPRKMHLSKYLIAITSLILIIMIPILILTNVNQPQTISSGYDSGSGFGGGASISFPGYVGLSTSKKSDLSNPVKFSFSYGHDYSANDFMSETSVELIGHYIEVFVYDGKSGLQKFGEQNYSDYQKLYDESFQNHAFLDEQYKILNETLWIWSKIKYQKNFDLEIDFSKVEIDSGRIVIKISEMTLYRYEENGEQLEEQVIANRYAYLYFDKGERVVTFKK